MKVSFAELKQEIIEKTFKKYENEISKLKIENEHLKNTLKKLKREIKK
jgi:predicted RNase H-like nuclease (RuvC/YqgF family)